jgi:hypothetical protein
MGKPDEFTNMKLLILPGAVSRLALANMPRAEVRSFIQEST